MQKPMIGILPLIDMEKDSYWMLPGYMEGIEAAGGIPVMLPLTEDETILERLAESFDGFLFTGGQDVSPELYGEEVLPECGECSPERDAMERILLEKILMSGKPLLGICRGIQLLNAALGGTLYQDLPAQHPGEINHHMMPPYDRAVHKVTLKPSAPLYEILGAGEIAVNSYHHQAVKELAKALEVSAVSEDGLVEGVYMPDKKFVMAVQWHPEFSYLKDENARKIFETFVKACAS